LFKNQDFETVEAAKGLSLDDLVKVVGCKPINAKIIYNRLQANQAPPPEKPVSHGDNNQIIPMPQQLQLLQLQMNLETAKKFSELEAQLKINQMEAKHSEELKDVKHKADIDSMKKDIEHQKLLQKLENEKTSAIYEGKLAVLEEKNKQKPVVYNSLPPWWNGSYGNWDPFYVHFPYSSVLLSPHFFRTIQGWLGGNRHWNLRYRGTRDGFNATDFHRCCDNIGPTVTIIRASGYLFGGYTPLPWNQSSGYQNSSACFLFTLTNSIGSSPTHFYSKGTNSIYCSSGYGPTFGSGHDLHISSNCHSNTSSYSNFPHGYTDSLGQGKNTFAGAYTFTVSDIEVFTV